MNKDTECKACKGVGCVRCDPKKLKKPVVESSTTYDERRKVLVHKVKEEKETELGGLIVTSEATLHEEGIKKSLRNFRTRKKNFEENIKNLNEVLEEPPKMNPELEALKKNLQTLQLIDYAEKNTDAKRKKDQEDLDKFKKDLEVVEKDIKDIKQAVGTRLKL